jgi:hypothetical protein
MSPLRLLPSGFQARNVLKLELRARVILIGFETFACGE